MPIMLPLEWLGLSASKPRASSQSEQGWNNSTIMPPVMPPGKADQFVSSIKAKALAGGIMDIIGSLPKSFLRKILPERWVNSSLLLPARLGLFAGSLGLFYSLYQDLEKLRLPLKSNEGLDERM